MADIPTYADTLRAIGLILDSHRARHAEIIVEKHAMVVSWDQGGASQRRSYSELKIKQLQEAARRMRGDPSFVQIGPRAEILRTLGQELDEAHMEVQGIIEEEGGYRVSGTADRRYVNHLYTLAELQVNSQDRRVLRLVPSDTGSDDVETDSSPPSPWWWRILRWRPPN